MTSWNKESIPLQSIPSEFEISEPQLMLDRLSKVVVMRDCKKVKELTATMVKDEVDLFAILNQGPR